MPEQHVGYIYSIIDPFTGYPIYVGQTTNLKRRFSDHIWESKVKIGYNPHKEALIRKILERNRDPIMVAIWVGSVQELDKMEDVYMKGYQKAGFKLTNIAPAGPSPTRGTVRSKETKAKISLANRGRKLSDETRAKMSRDRKGRPVSEAAKIKISQKLKGIKRPPEHGQKISKTLTGRKLSPEHVQKMRERSEETKRRSAQGSMRMVVDQFGTEYESVKKAAEIIGISLATIQRILHGKQQSSKGFIIRYKE